MTFTDAHEVVLPLDAPEAWRRLRAAISRSRLLGARGFPEREEVAPRRMRLAGAHLFAAYDLCFDLEDVAPAHTRVRATTHAQFKPGLGALYRALVIGSGAHARIVRRFLRALATKA